MHRYSLRVYNEDTDVSRAADHAYHLRWMERARTKTLRLCGIDHAASATAGQGAYAAASVAVRYLEPARLDDALTVATRPLLRRG